MEEETIYIPVFDSEDVIAVPIGLKHAVDPEEVRAAAVVFRSVASAAHAPFLSQYADPGTVHRQVLECLKAEEAPLSLWLDVVKAYLAAGHTMHAERMLREGTGAEV
jgi:hypothetical protein